MRFSGSASVVGLLGFQVLLAVAAASGNQFQTLIVDDAQPQQHRASEETTTWPGSLSVELVHRDVLLVQKQGFSKQELLIRRLARDAARVEAIFRRVQVAVSGDNPAIWVPKEGQMRHGFQDELDISSPIVSGLSQGSGEYFTRFGIGTPPTDAYFVMDTGSDISWTQCRPCNRCYKQSDPLFNPSASSSFQAITCSSPLCSQLLVRGCQAQSNQCMYQVSYGDGSFTVGNFVLETFTVGVQELKNVAVGCGHDNEGLFVGAAGLLGLGQGKLSFPSQVNLPFSYCLADRFRGTNGQLVFGQGAAPAGSSFAQLQKNDNLGTFYYVDLSGIAVGGRRLPITPSDFALQPSGIGGTILDSGTSITRLAGNIYPTLRDAFLQAGASKLPSAGSFSLFDTCFGLDGRQSIDVPSVDLLFVSGATVSLPASNYLIPVDTTGTYCFAFAPSSGRLSIIGNTQQQGFRVSFDAINGRVGFAPQQC